MANLSSSISVITLSINNLNSPIKRQRFAKWMKKHELTIYCLQEGHLKFNTIGSLKWNEKKNAMQTLYINNIDCTCVCVKNLVKVWMTVDEGAKSVYITESG